MARRRTLFCSALLVSSFAAVHAQTSSTGALTVTATDPSGTHTFTLLSPGEDRVNMINRTPQVFNDSLANHPQFASPASNAGSAATYGVIAATTVSPPIIQFALRYAF